MVKYDKNTETKILDAAQEEFLHKGMTGARMQGIANRAGINKALLHYYYRTKEKLFLAVFNVAIAQFVPKIYSILISPDIHLFDKIRVFIEKYSKILLKNQFIPLFVLHEINRNPEKLVEIIKSKGIEPELFFAQVQKEIKNGTIRPIDPRGLIINMLSLTIFPIGGRPLLQRMVFNNDKKAYEQFLKQRIKEVPEFIIQSIKL